MSELYEDVSVEQLRNSLEKILLILDLMSRFTETPIDNVSVIALKFLIDQKWFVAALAVVVNMYFKDGLTTENGNEIRKEFIRLLRHNDD